MVEPALQRAALLLLAQDHIGEKRLRSAQDNDIRSAPLNADTARKNRRSRLPLTPAMVDACPVSGPFARSPEGVAQWQLSPNYR
ncbi:MAG: hypothetical protein GPOALKHO_001562 [Sodalis sp.]|uniref:hypothetical protein n=1 Tax=Sodalis sp. (in: enterobacteria) TaxID=1898979 RepID=UPI003873BB16|nr:MAG: hypothetical protein GPOALKHO_001562 [Sodalis sp.]